MASELAYFISCISAYELNPIRRPFFTESYSFGGYNTSEEGDGAEFQSDDSLTYDGENKMCHLILLLGKIIYKSLFLRYDREKTPPPTGKMLLLARRQEATWKRSPTN